MKELTNTDAIEFREYFYKKYPDLSSHFPTIPFLNGNIALVRPKTMDKDTDWEETKAVLTRWLRNGGFL